MCAQAAYAKLCRYSTVSTGDSGWATFPGINTASMSLGGEILDDTAFSTEAGNDFRSRMRGLNDFSFNFTADWSTAAGSTQLYDAWKDRNTFWFDYRPNGTAGYKGRVVVESLELSGEVAGKEQITVTLQGDGGFAATT